MTAESDFARFEQLLGRLLVTSVIVSAVLMATGLGFWLRLHESIAAARLLRAGIFVLMATPILRVLVSVVEYVRMRDWLFALTTVTVLAELAFSCLYALKAR